MIDLKRIRLFYRMTKNLVALPGIFSLFTLLFFITGNFQGFSDSTQSIILTTLGISSVFFAIVSFCGLIEGIFFLFIKNLFKTRQKVLFIIAMVLCLISAVTLLSMSLVLGVLTEGL
ncbi:MAG: hypothetical protein MJ185_03590 [Treponema sp.]|nr:hypothetical protein [Treponema sp.]